MNNTIKNQDIGINPPFKTELNYSSSINTDCNTLGVNSPYSTSSKNTECITLDAASRQSPPESWLNDTPPIDCYSMESSHPNPSFTMPSSLFLLTDDAPDNPELAELRKTANYKKAKKAGRVYLAEKKAGNKAHFSIHDRYALACLCVAVDLGIESIKIKSDMNSGKSYAIRWLLQHHPLVDSVLQITALAALNQAAITSAVKSGIKAIAYNDMRNDDNHEFVSSTFNSLHKVIQKRGSAQFSIVLIDESEQCAGFMTSGNDSISNLSQATKAIKDVCFDSKFVVLADAHIGIDSHAFSDRFCGERDFCQVFNSYQVWSELTYSVSDSYEAGIARIEELLSMGKNVFTVFTSGALAHKTMVMLEQQGVTANIEKIEVSKTTKNQKEAKSVLDNPDNFKLYSLGAISPIAGTGISIEGEHFHETVAFITRDFKHTPNSKSALQTLTRVRELIDKHITIITIDNQQIGAIESFEEVAENNEVVFEYHNIVRELADSGDKRAKEAYKRGLRSQLMYDATIEKNKISDYWNFWDNFLGELEKKGMTEVHFDNHASSFDIKEASNDAKEEIKERARKSFNNAEYVNDDDYKKLVTADKYNPENMTESQANQLKKRIIVDRFVPLLEGGTPTLEQSNQAYNLYLNGFTKAVNNIHLSQLTDKESKKLLNASVNGIGSYLDHKLDDYNLSDTKRYSETAIFKPVSVIIGLKKDDDGLWFIKNKLLTDDLCRSKEGRRNQALILKDAISAYNAFHPKEKISKKELDKSPALFVRGLLKKLKIQYKKVRGENAYILADSQPMLGLLNSGVKNNKFDKKLLEVDKSVHRDNERKIQADIELRIDDAVFPVLKLPLENKVHLVTHLMRTPSNMIDEAINKYLELALASERVNHKFSPIAWAHKMLEIDADFYELG